MSNELFTDSRTAPEPAASITFTVDDVAPASTLLPTCKALDAVRKLLDTPPERFAADESSQGSPTHGRVEACWNYALDCVADVGVHPLIAAAHLAFSGHRPLVLSPDVIWVTIVQGLAQHIRLNPETHRGLLVRHEGKRELKVERNDLHRGSPENPWAEVIAELARAVHREVGELAERLVCDFSTTGPVERLASEVALLDVLQPYFSYNVVCICGIPSVTLEGTPGDWQKLRERVELLAPFGLDWWLSELRPICDQFARAASGDIDRQHWRRMYKIRAVYGAEVINGWFGKLFPYAKDMQSGSFSRRNCLLDPEVEAEIRKLEAEEARGRKQEHRFHAPGIDAEVLPRGMSQVPFTLTDLSGEKTAMEFLAGPLVVTQDGETGSLRPTLGWAVRESPPIEQALIRLADHHIEPAQAGPSWEELFALHVHYIPTDVVRFYTAVASAVIHGKDGTPLYRILPLSEWNNSESAHDRNNEPDDLNRWERQELLRFAKSSDGTELGITVSGPERKNTGTVIARCRSKDGSLDATCQKVARSFTDFLLRALDGGSEPYFRRADFVPLT